MVDYSPHQPHQSLTTAPPVAHPSFAALSKMAPMSSAEMPPIKRGDAVPRILCAGVIVLDEVFCVEEFPRPDGKVQANGFFVVNGGCAANAAVAIARLGGEDDTEWAAITVCYGTDANNVPQWARTNNLLIREGEFRALGLHKPTVFKLDLRNRQRLPWAEDYFVSQRYVVGQGIVAGRLADHQQTLVRGCLTARGLQFPLP
jgi:hypothetical protein